MTRKMFAGTNSPMGFIDFFDNIMPPPAARRRYFLKGSSGSGKSTLMKAVAAALEENGHVTERFYCSNDAQSLDAVTVPAIGLCVLDATAPHARDPEICGAVDVLIDLGQFLNAGKLAGHVDELITLGRRKKALYQDAADYLAKINIAAERPAPPMANDVRRLFASAITPDGVVDLAAECFRGATQRKLASQADLLTMLGMLRDEGHDVECFHNPLNPAEIQYLHIPVLKMAFYVEMPSLPQNAKSQLDIAVEKFAAGRQIHAKIEEIYVAAMDFGGVDAIRDCIIEHAVAKKNYCDKM